jgi:hypothetical protein
MKWVVRLILKGEVGAECGEPVVERGKSEGRTPGGERARTAESRDPYEPIWRSFMDWRSADIAVLGEGDVVVPKDQDVKSFFLWEILLMMEYVVHFWLYASWEAFLRLCHTL